MNGRELLASSLVTLGGHPVTPGTDWTIEAVADFDGDTRSDILWRSAHGEVGLWTMDGAEVASSALVTQGGHPVTVPDSWSVAGTADFNADGESDVLWRNSDGTLGLWQMDGATLVAASVITHHGNAINLGTHWTVAGIGDYAGEGMADILLRSSAGKLAIWSMNGAAVQTATLVNDGTSPIVLGNDWQIAATT
jgi:hypothetical protein